MNHGAQYTIGESALVRIENSDLLIQSFAQQPNDLAQFKVAGVNPDDYQIILLKGAAALRANWTSKVDVFYNASSMGMTDCILERLSYKKLNNSIWPLNRSLLPEFNVQHQL
jgi:microcystin degradation protein MlrC